VTLQFHLILTIILIAVVMGVVQGTCAYLILLERKISAWAQDRIGPNRVGPFGLLQPIADGAKFLLKEELIPKHVDRLFYLLAPAVAISAATLAIAVVPFGATTVPPSLEDRRTDEAIRRAAQPPTDPARLQEYLKEVAAAKDFREESRGPIWPQTKSDEVSALAADSAYAEARGVPTFGERVKTYNQTIQFVIVPHADIGIVYVFAVGSLAVYGVVLAGWSSNNKYSFLGALRSSAQLVSYEIPMALSVLGVLLLTGSLNLERIIAYQYDHGWNVLFQPLACLMFVTSIFAECNRLPFDLPEAEQELVGGYHTEYSGLKFGLFFLGEYTHMITTSFLAAALFFGGWLLPGVVTPAQTGVGWMIVKLIVFAVKMGLFICFFMIIRWTIPRFRYDQLMGLAWKVLIPLGLANVVAVLVVKGFLIDRGAELSVWLLLPLSLLILVGGGAVALYFPRAPARRAYYFRGLGPWLQKDEG
jgi:NADH-quinone oxidoreductase subunit H